MITAVILDIILTIIGKFLSIAQKHNSKRFSIIDQGLAYTIMLATMGD